MFGADVAKRGGLAFFCMVEAEAAFVHHAAGLRVAVIITAPDSCKSQFLETSLQQAAHGL